LVSQNQTKLCGICPAKKIGAIVVNQRVAKAFLDRQRQHVQEGSPRGRRQWWWILTTKPAQGEIITVILTWRTRGSRIQVIALEIYVSFR